MDPVEKSSGKKILESLNRYNIDPEFVSYIFVSHRHNDHAGGVPVLENNVKIKTIYTPGHTSDHFMFSTLLPNSFSPSFTYNNYLSSLKKMLDFDVVGFSHYGAVFGNDAKNIVLSGLNTLNE